MKLTFNKVIFGYILQYALISSSLLLFAPVGRKDIATTTIIIIGLLTYWSKRKAPLDYKNYLMSPRACKITFAVLAPVLVIWWALIQKSSTDQLPWLLGTLAALLTLVITSRPLNKNYET